MLKKLSLVSLLTASLLADITTVVPYAGLLNYSSESIRDNGYFSGLYASNASWTNKFEIGAEYTTFQYKNRAITPLVQRDFTIAYTRYFTEKYNLKGAYHLISSSDDATDGGNIYLLNFTTNPSKKLDISLEAAYSSYKDSFNVLQGRTSVGRVFGDYNSMLGSFHVQGAYKYIKPSTATINNLKSSYDSFHMEVINYNGDFTTTLSTWTGSEVYAVTNGGFSVDNLADEKKGAVALAVRYAFTPAMGLTLNGKLLNMREAGATVDSSSSVLGATFDYSY
ncbi:MAG: hypothetical protein GQ570_03055 [Helicobacteraceae bacterium]|nr:hypothetical protein [Helicobacteraceae bacterium]